MPLRTKCIYEPKAAEDGFRILVSRLYPRGVKRERLDEWTRQLSPSKDLLYSYRKGEKDWGEFARVYLGELGSNPGSLALVKNLHDRGRRETVTMLCYERSGMPCHRHVLRLAVERPSLLQDAGWKAKPPKILSGSFAQGEATNSPLFSDYGE